MAIYQWGVVCQQVIIDQYTNNVSYLNTVEEIKPPELPTQIPYLFVGSLWRRDDGPEIFNTRIKVVDDDEVKVFTSDTDEVNLEDHKRFRSNLVIGGFEIDKGTLWFCPQLEREGEWITKARLPVDISPPEDR